VILIDALQPGCLTHKYVDDTTMTEVLGRSAVSSMLSFIDELVQQATDAGMIVNGRKTKELLIGPVLKDPQPSVERVTAFNGHNMSMSSHRRQPSDYTSLNS